jgi:hypothetical protein
MGSCHGRLQNGGINMSKFLLTVCAFGLLFSSALAQEKTLEQLDKESNRIWAAEGLRKEEATRVVASGTKQLIGGFTALNPDCTASGDVNVRVTKQPEHGTVEISSSSFYPGYPKENIRSKCNHHKVRGQQIHYKSAGEYVGDDALDLLVLFPGGFARELHINISVR